ncbi:hypothetical protein F5884DRAFT_789754 [Xylogone sp. PMI_703]|nr:hypothetical protein F5884DRAFT_789754 [Xylogone sp. PMI_703]
MTTTPPSLTEHLFALDPEKFKVATQSKFLEKAGNGTLSKEILQEWLAQDRLYAQAYIRFASLLLANLPLPSTVSPNHINERLVDLIIGAITNVRRELKFFETVASHHGLVLEASTVGAGVRAYRDLFTSIGEEIEKDECSILDGFVLLWATEKCYLDAWTYASTFSAPVSSPPEQDCDGGALRKEFIPNWSSPDFKQFVDKCAEAVDEIWAGLQEERNGELLVKKSWWGLGRDGENKAQWLERLGGLWKEVLEAEKIFWPDVKDENELHE